MASDLPCSGVFTSIPEVKDALSRLTLEACREGVLAAIAEAGDAAESRRIFEEKLGTALAGQS